MLRKRHFVIGTALLLAAIGLAVTWSWTHTPHGRLDYRAALSLNLLSFTTTIQPREDSDFELTFPVNLAYGLSNMLPAEKVSRTEEVTIPSAEGDIPARVYWPRDFDRLESPPPVITYFHGGGFVVGDIDIFDHLTRSVANATSSIVVSVDYRLAPENPYPAAVNDCYAALSWVAQQAESLGGDPGRLVVAGDSAGGHLAAVTALRSRNEDGPAIAAQILYYPGADLTDTHYGSHETFADGYGLSSESMAVFRDSYVGHVEDRSDPYVSPMYAEHHRALPPALIVTAGFDPLTDIARAYGQRLKDDGVSVSEVHYPGMIHGFMSVRLFSQRREALDETADFLRGLPPN